MPSIIRIRFSRFKFVVFFSRRPRISFSFSDMLRKYFKTFFNSTSFIETRNYSKKNAGGFTLYFEFPPKMKREILSLSFFCKVFKFEKYIGSITNIYNYLFVNICSMYLSTFRRKESKFNNNKRVVIQ